MASFEEHINNERIRELQLLSYTGPVEIVETLEDVDRCVREIQQNYKYIGFDTETRPVFIKGKTRKVSLLQLSGIDKAYLFRLHKIGLPQSLINILTSEDLIKIGVDLMPDMRKLKEWQSFEPAGIIDLQKIVADYGIVDTSLRKLVAIILKRRLSKRQQLSNWEAVDLSSGQIRYAATDAWVCLKLYKELLKTK